MQQEHHDLEVCADCVIAIEYGHAEGSDHEWPGILADWNGYYVVNGRACPAPFQIGTIIHGTMRFCDVAPALIGEIERVGGTVDPSWLDCPEDEQVDVMDEIWRELDSLSPDGFYFGAHCGDGSDFGLWQIEDDRAEFARFTCDCCGRRINGAMMHYATAWKR